MTTITKTLAGINDPGALIDCKSYSNTLADSNRSREDLCLLLNCHTERPRLYSTMLEYDPLIASQHLHDVTDCKSVLQPIVLSIVVSKGKSYLIKFLKKKFMH